MMFLVKATLCIGLVAAAASQAGGPGLATALDREARDAATRATRACLASNDCVRMGSGVLAAASPLALPEAEAPSSRRQVAPPAAAAPTGTPSALHPRGRHWRSGTGQAI